MLQFNIVTIFPKMFISPFEESLLKKAQEKGLIKIKIYDLRDFTKDKHRMVDDYPYGGGAGMLMKVEPIVSAIEHLNRKAEQTRVILLSPQGETFTQKKAELFAQYANLILICGRYEGIDERVLHFVDEEISIGDYILSGGEIAGMVIVDSVSRLIPGVVGDRSSVLEDSFSGSLLKYPQYTRPKKFRTLEVPQILLSGDHKNIQKWKRKEALKKTIQKRPDLLNYAVLNDEDKRMLSEFGLSN